MGNLGKIVIACMLGAAALALIGCQSTDPYSYRYVEMQDKSGLIHPIEVSGAVATLVIRAEPHTAYSAKTFTLDGDDVIKIPEGQQYTAQITAGYHVIGAHCDPLDRRQEIPLQAEAGKTYFFRIYDTADAICLFAPMGR